MIVLDTHILVWYALGSPQLSAARVRQIQAAAPRVFISAISLWEVAMLLERGRLSGFSVADLRKVIAASGFQEANLSGEMAVMSRRLGLPHQDPADRFIAATAVAMRATLVTDDENLVGFAWLPTA
ncbi:MAG: type II toxin-antitoxin system VapC family toxin [Fimbriimonadaceae bacterium]|nr:type II toxin-antitoxin system VapC family toxin [Fimbriimonadaceae bacterium]